MKKYTKKDYNTGELNILTAERVLILKVLNLLKGKRQICSTVLGISERTLSVKIKKHAIEQNVLRKYE
jgi:DNA-binding NtrC family response regulator